MRTTTPLYILAQEHRLEELQLMDRETLGWMKDKCKPTELHVSSVAKDYCPLKLEQFKQYIPQKKWFLKKSHAISIHGISHILRVMLYSLVIQQYLELKIRVSDLLIATSVHDLRRKDDKGDPGHGKRAGLWFKDNLSLFSKFQIIFEKDIVYAVANHEVQSELINSRAGLYEDKLLLILQTADALDRYRLPKEKWWPNPKLFRCKIPKSFLDFVKFFTYQTGLETLHKNFDKTIKIIIQSSLRVGVLAK